MSVLIVGLSYGARSVLSCTRCMMHNFLAFRDNLIIPLRRSPKRKEDGGRGKSENDDRALFLPFRSLLDCGFRRFFGFSLSLSLSALIGKCKKVKPLARKLSCRCLSDWVWVAEGRPTSSQAAHRRQTNSRQSSTTDRWMLSLSDRAILCSPNRRGQRLRERGFSSRDILPRSFGQYSSSSTEWLHMM